MQPEASAAVIGFAASLPLASIVMLEQHLPTHPIPSAFDIAMLRHFSKKVKTPLYGTERNPTLVHKRAVLEQAGWSHVHLSTLQDYYHHALREESTKEAAQRATTTEPFDEMCAHLNRHGCLTDSLTVERSWISFWRTTISPMLLIANLCLSCSLIRWRLPSLQIRHMNQACRSFR